MLKIRSETADDQMAIHAIHAACFPTEAEAQLVDRLRDAGDLTVSLVAIRQGALVGHVALSPVTVTADNAAKGLGLAPIGVAGAQRKQGIGAALVGAGLEASRNAGYGWVVVLGEPAYYRRFGFRPATGFGLEDAYGGGDAFMTVELIEGALPRHAGLVRYAPAFDLLG